MWVCVGVGVCVGVCVCVCVCPGLQPPPPPPSRDVFASAIVHWTACLGAISRALLVQATRVAATLTSDTCASYQR